MIEQNDKIKYILDLIELTICAEIYVYKKNQIEKVILFKNVEKGKKIKYKIAISLHDPGDIVTLVEYKYN